MSPALSQLELSGTKQISPKSVTETTSMYSQFHQKNMSNPYYLQAFRERQASSQLATNLDASARRSEPESPEYGNYQRPTILFANDSNSV
jgi:hypothetical protein